MKHLCDCRTGEIFARHVRLNDDDSVVFLSLECLLCGKWSTLTGDALTDRAKVKAYLAEKIIQRRTLCHCHLGRVRLKNVNATGYGHELVGECLGERCPRYAAATNYPVVAPVNGGTPSKIKLPYNLTRSPRPRKPKDYLDPDPMDPEELE